MLHSFFTSIEQAHLIALKLSQEKQEKLDTLLHQIHYLWEGAPAPLSCKEEFLPPSQWTTQGEVPTSHVAGEQLLAQGKVAVFLFAGGLGSRLKSSEPKGCFPICDRTGKSLFEFFFEKITAREKRYQISIPVILGLSSFTKEATLNFLKKNHFFNKDPSSIHFLVQKDYPYFDIEGKILFSDEELIPMAPAGNGAFYDSLKESSLVKDLLQQGISLLHLVAIDNPLDDPLDPYLMGEMERQHSDAGLLAVKRETPKEKTGLIVEKKGCPVVADYMELSDDILRKASEENTPYFLGNIGHYCLKLDFLQSLIDQNVKLPFHFIPKEIALSNLPKKVLKAEKFAMDLLEFSPRTTLVVCPRENHFSPLKQLEGKGGIEEVRRHLKNQKFKF